MVIKFRKKSYHINGDKVFDIVVTIAMYLVALLFLLPLLNVLANSFSNPDAILAGKVTLFPVDFDLSGYQSVLSNSKILIGFRNSVLYTVIGTAIQVTIELLAAYPLSRKDFKGRKIINIILTMTMYVSGGMIPLYILIGELNMFDTCWAIIIPACCSVYTIIVIRTYISTSIPYELQEAARIDGCSDFKIFLKVILPLSRPIIFVAALFGIVCYWNSYFPSLLYLQSSNLYPLQRILSDIIASSNSGSIGGTSPEQAEQLKYVTIVVSSVPLLVAYPFFQKYFEKGMTVGGMKG